MKKTHFLFLMGLFALQMLFAQEEQPKVYSLVSDLRIRSSPNTKAAVVGKMALKDSAYSISFSENTETITLRGREITDNWIEIETMNGTKGWVFGGAVATWNVFPNAPKDAKSKAAITINDDGYVIKGKNGATKSLTSQYPFGTMGSEEMKVYRFDRYIPELKAFGFYVSFYESGNYVIVNEDDASDTEITDAPVVSPSKKQFVCLWNVEGSSGLTLYQINGSTVKEVWDKDFEEGQIFFEKVQWVNEKEVKLIGNKYTEEGTAIPSSVIFDLSTKKIRF